jgi:hypothetical protein
MSGIHFESEIKRPPRQHFNRIGTFVRLFPTIIGMRKNIANEMEFLGYESFIPVNSDPVMIQPTKTVKRPVKRTTKRV